MSIELEPLMDFSMSLVDVLPSTHFRLRQDASPWNARRLKAPPCGGMSHFESSDLSKNISFLLALKQFTSCHAFLSTDTWHSDKPEKAKIIIISQSFCPEAFFFFFFWSTLVVAPERHARHHGEKADNVARVAPLPAVMFTSTRQRLVREVALIPPVRAHRSRRDQTFVRRSGWRLSTLGSNYKSSPLNDRRKKRKRPLFGALFSPHPSPPSHLSFFLVFCHRDVEFNTSLIENATGVKCVIILPWQVLSTRPSPTSRRLLSPLEKFPAVISSRSFGLGLVTCIQMFCFCFFHSLILKDKSVCVSDDIICSCSAKCFVGRRFAVQMDNNQKHSAQGIEVDCYTTVKSVTHLARQRC